MSPTFRHSTDSRPVPLAVNVFALAAAALGLSLTFIFGAGVSQAFAAETWTGTTFTYNGKVYPSSLAGVVVTFNSNPGAPDSYLGNTENVPMVWRSGTWYDVGGYNVSDYSGNEVLSRVSAPYFICESSSVTNPWFIGWNVNGNSTPVRGMQYYNGGSNVRAWYAHQVTSNRTYQFPGQLGALSGVSNLLLHHDFIRYIVDNSDFRSRYSIPSEAPSLVIDTTFGTNNITVEWTGNPDIFIQKRVGTDGWETVQYVPSPSPYTYVVSESGTYRVFATQSGYQDYTSGGHSFSIEGLQFESGTIVLASDFSTLSVTADFIPPLPSGVYVQYANDNPVASDYGVWNTLLPVLTNTAGGHYEYTYPWSEARQYCRVRLMVEANGQVAYFDLGKTAEWTDTGDFDFDSAISNVVKWIHQFSQSFGDLFAWLPSEIRVVLISVIIVMVLLGLIGWLKK